VISVNGEPAPDVAGTTLAALLTRMGVVADARGVAVAVDGEVVPRGRWEQFELGEECRVEVLSAMQGG
jgi:sulfur carrier protein